MQIFVVISLKLFAVVRSPCTRLLNDVNKTVFTVLFSTMLSVGRISSANVNFHVGSVGGL